MKKLLYLFLAITVACSSGDDSTTPDSNDPNNNVPPTCDVVYLDSNGVTIRACPDSNVGDSGEVSGVTYTIVDEATLRQMVENSEDVTVVCTSKVTDMNSLLLILDEFGDIVVNDFNQDISSWDTANVSNMSRMFAGAFEFNQSIENWDVSNVSNMRLMFRDAIFNQDIGNWDVSNVTDMAGMFDLNAFFNQNISNWDVSNVTDMEGMFFDTPFNQDISGWDVSNVTNMGLMFWGATNFNQNLSSWNVENVIECTDFDFTTPQWTLPKPNFTNCTP